MVRIHDGSSLATGSRLWRWRGRRYRTVEAISSYAIGDGGSLELRSSPRRESPDPVAPHRRRADVRVEGAGHAPTAVRELEVRFAIHGHAGTTMRRLRLSAAESTTRLPIGWDRAAFDPILNPQGRRDGVGQLDPDAPELPMSWEGIPEGFPVRRDRAGADWEWRADDPMALDDAYDWRFWQSAPERLQIPPLLGDEGVELWNLTPDPVVRLRLPRLAVHGRLRLPGQSAQSLVTICDGLLIRPDLRIVSTRRSSFGWPSVPWEPSRAGRARRAT